MTISNTAISSKTELSSGLTSTDELFISDGGTLKRMDVSVLTTYNATLTETLTNKTLTTPKFAHGGFIADANDNEMLVFQTTTSAANALEITNSATGNAIIIGAFGSDGDVDINITPKGTGEVNITAGLTTGTLGCGVLTASTGSEIGNLTFANGSITDSSGAISLKKSACGGLPPPFQLFGSFGASFQLFSDHRPTPTGGL